MTVMSSTCERLRRYARAGQLAWRGAVGVEKRIHSPRLPVLCGHVREKEAAGRPAEECFREVVCAAEAANSGVY